MKLEEKRDYPRIAVNAQIKVRNLLESSQNDSTPREWRAISTTLIDLSHSGAKFHVNRPFGTIGELIEMILPLTDNKDIFVVARILRAEKQADGYVIAVQFVSLAPEHKERLEKLLMILLASAGGGERQHPRVALRLEIQYGDAAELMATLENISKGGLLITVPNPFELKQSIQLVISTTANEESITLQGRVVHQHPITLAGKEVFRVGLKFEHEQREIEERVGPMLESILRMKKKDKSKAKTRLSKRR